MPNDIIPIVNTRRAELIQLFVITPDLRAYLHNGLAAHQEQATRFESIVQTGDIELARSITDAEIAQGHRALAGTFAEDFPAGI
ncbi:TPA: hypothetical protein DEP96_01150 [Candidatus Uhrbacteria bacterium]|nr:hypothetical protein [Candidatus Uhrbacteria bacterium]